MQGRRLRLRRRLLILYGRHHRLFWALHSLWALAAGILVLALSHRRYGLAVWVMAFLGVTWLSTLFFTRLPAHLSESPIARFGSGLASYLTRTMYQETLFFLLPFYFTSATWPSWNMLFVALMAVLATLACLDTLFDQLLRRHHGFGLAFFAVVAFAAVNFLLPVVFGMRPGLATPLAGAIGLLAALPLAYEARDLVRPRPLLEIGGAILLTALLLWPGRALVPPVPLRLASFEFGAEIELEPLRPFPLLQGSASLAGDRLDGIVAVAGIFAPKRLPSLVILHWLRDGERVRTSRTAEITPHALGFRVWDALPGTAELGPGTLTVEVRTAAGQLIGRSRLKLSP